MSEDKIKLQDERRTLAVQLNDRTYGEGRDNTPNDRVMRSLTKSHNQIVSKILKLTESLYHKRDPLEMLPDDVWVEIIHMEMRDEGIPVPVFNRLTALRRVSRRWANLIGGKDSLWTDVDLRSSEQPLDAVQRRLFIQLQRSGDLRLSITADISSSDWRTGLEPFLLPHADRVRSFVHVHPSLDTLAFDFDILSQFKRLESLRLEVEVPIFIPHGANSVMAFLLENPQLRVLDGIALDATQLGVYSKSSLRKMSFWGPAATLWPLLRTQPHLHSVTLCPHMTPYGLGMEGPSDFPTFTEVLPWTELKYWQSDYVTLLTILSQTAITLKRLTVVMEVPKITSLLHALQNLQSLETLHLVIQSNISLQIDEILSSPLNGQHLSSILNIVLEFGLRVGFAPVNPTRSGRRSRPQRTYIDSLLLYFPMVQTVKIIQSTAFEPFPLRLDGLTQLRYLDCSGGIVPYRGNPSAQLVIHKLGLGCDRHALKTIDIPTLASLNLAFTHESWFDCDEAGTFDLVGSRWLQLRFLSIHLSEASRNIAVSFELPNLHTFEIHTVRGGTAGFLYHGIAQHPGGLPSLEKLTIQDRLLDWDVLFILLERRIMMPTVTPIRALTLVFAPPSRILYPLVDRLQGLLTSRPPSKELSVDHTAKLLLESDNMGCLNCVQDKQKCSQTRSVPLKKDEVRAKLNTFLPYPQTDYEVLDTWMRRAKASWWMRMRIERRAIPCKGPTSKGMVTYTNESVVI